MWPQLQSSCMVIPNASHVSLFYIHGSCTMLFETYLTCHGESVTSQAVKQVRLLLQKARRGNTETVTF